MQVADVALILTASGMGAVISLAVALIRGIWVGRLPRFTIVGPSTLLALLAIGLLTSLRPSTPATMVAGVAVAGSPCAGAAGHFVGVSESGERARLTGTRVAQGSCAIWAAIEDPRTGMYWLQGPAQQEVGDSWTLSLVLGTDPSSPRPLSYRATVFAVDAETSADWLTIARASRHPLQTAAIPEPESWLAVAVPLGTPASTPGA
jgi:hypothetical protein